MKLKEVGVLWISSDNYIPRNPLSVVYKKSVGLIVYRYRGTANTHA